MAVRALPLLVMIAVLGALPGVAQAKPTIGAAIGDFNDAERQLAEGLQHVAAGGAIAAERNMRCIHLGLIERRVDGNPFAVQHDFVPGMATAGFLIVAHVHESGYFAGGNAGGASKRGEQQRVRLAVAALVLEQIGNVGPVRAE